MLRTTRSEWAETAGRREPPGRREPFTKPDRHPSGRRPQTARRRHPTSVTPAATATQITESSGRFAGIDKATLRSLARALGLREVADLAAAPCLSSRRIAIELDKTTLAALAESERASILHDPAHSLSCRPARGLPGRHRDQICFDAESGTSGRRVASRMRRWTSSRSSVRSTLSWWIEPGRRVRSATAGGSTLC